MECIPESPCSQTPCPTTGMDPCGAPAISSGACIVIQGVTCCPVNETTTPSNAPGQEEGGTGKPAAGKGQAPEVIKPGSKAGICFTSL